MPTFTKRAFLAARKEPCSWDAEKMQIAIDRRFPRVDSFDLVEYLDMLISDSSLSGSTLSHVLLALGRLSKESVRGAFPIGNTRNRSQPLLGLQRLRTRILELDEGQ